MLLFSRKVCGLHSLLPRLFKYSCRDRQEETLVTDKQMRCILLLHTHKSSLDDGQTRRLRD